MGWTFTHREPGMTTREFFEREVGFGSSYELLASGMTGSTFYAAMRDKKTGEVSAFVALTQRARDYHNFGYKDMDERMGPNEASAPARVLDLLSPLPECHHEQTYCRRCNAEIRQDEGGQWVYDPKPHQTPECGGPRCYHYSQGDRQDDGSAPFHQPGGHGWCGTQSARDWRQACRERLERIARSRAVRAGAVVKFARPISFQSGYKGDTFEFLKGDIFLGDGYRYRIDGWRETDFEIVSAV